MKALGITTVYDLRSETEMKKYKTPIPTIEGIAVKHTPVFRVEDYSPEVMARWASSALAAAVDGANNDDC